MGLLGGGAGANEDLVRKTCDTKGLEFSIVRAGALKGGGPGNEDLGLDLGLHKAYYNTIINTQQAMVTMAHDKYTLGPDVVAGDVKPSSGLQYKLKESSFEAASDESNRIVVAGAMVAAMQYDKPVEISVGCSKAQMPPTLEEWSLILATC